MGETLRVQEETLDVCLGHTRKLPGSLVFQSLRWHRPVPLPALGFSRVTFLSKSLAYKSSTQQVRKNRAKTGEKPGDIVCHKPAEIIQL